MIARARALLLHFACAGALLLAQHDALTHQIWHAAATGGLHQFATAAQENGKPQAPQERLCGLHAALGAVLGALGCAATAVQQVLATEIPHRVAALPATSSRGLRPASRGPPALL